MKKLSLSKKEKKNLTRILIALGLFLVVFILDKILVLGDVFSGNFGWIFPFCLYLIIYLIIGYDVIWRAIRNICHGRVFDENFLMCVATLGAFGLAIYRGATGQHIEGFDEACAVLLFYQIGEFFQVYATGKSRRTISELMDIRPDYANLIKDGSIVVVDPSEIKAGDIILVRPGEKVPLDGVVTKGTTTLDTKALTGESLPQEVSINSNIISGSVNISSQIEMRVTKEFYNSTVSKILDLVESASDKKSKAENFITKFSKYYTPIVVILALLIAIIPSIITSDWSTWIYRALSFLVVSCPCALVISVPLTFFAGIGTASKYNILIKGSNYLEKLNQANIFVFDKTGTLTKGNFVITKIIPEDKKDEILHLAAIAEHNSDHPIAKAITSKYTKNIDNDYTLTNIAGLGIVANKGKDSIYCGNEKLMKKYNIPYVKEADLGTVVYVARNQEFIGSFLIEDEIKNEAKETIAELKALDCKTIMLTGDNDAIAKNVASKLSLSDYKSSLLPQDKVSELENMLKAKGKKDVLCFVGDGINDAPALIRSDIGIAMGGLGSDAAIEASDIVLMKDDLKSISIAKRIAKKTMRIVSQNIIVSIAVKIAILILSVFGITNMWFSVFGDVGVAVLAILNAMRVNSKY